MSDSLMVMIGIFLAAILCFIFPLMSVSEQNNAIAQSAVQTSVSNFVSDIVSKGEIDVGDLEKFQQEINAAEGAPYDIEIEVQHLDDNFSAKLATVASDFIGENARYSTFTAEILDAMYKDNGEKHDYILKKGDNVIITVKNVSATLAEKLRSVFYQITGDSDLHAIAASASGMVINNGSTAN